MEDLRLSPETIRALSQSVGETLLRLRSPRGAASSGWIAADFSDRVLVLSPRSCTGCYEAPEAEYFCLTVQSCEREPQLERWPGGPSEEWSPLAGAPSSALPATVLSGAPWVESSGNRQAHTGVEFVFSSGFR